MNIPHIFEVNLKWNEVRKGTLSSPVLKEEIEVATPPVFPGGMPGIWSPEHLLTAAVSSCFMTTFLAIAENSKLAFSEFTCNAKGVLDTVDGKFIMTKVELQPTLTINDASQKERAEKILQKSEAACLISNSIKSTVSLSPTIHIKI